MAIIAVGTVSAQMLIPVIAHADTAFQYARTSIVVAGESMFLPKHIVALDPWSGKPTSWVPLYYLQQVLKMEGVVTTWNGNTLDVTSIPSGWNVNVSGAPQLGTPPTGQMQFSIGGNQYDFVRAPKLVANDAYTMIPTTYVPVYYANLFLQQRLLMGVSWANTTWSMASPLDVNTIVMTATPSSVNVGQGVTISGEFRLAGGLGSPDVQLNISGLPNTNDKTIVTDSKGQFSFSTIFSEPGQYTVTIGNKADSRHVNVTVK